MVLPRPNAADQKPYLRLEAVSFSRTGETILDGFDLALEMGAQCALLGPSGSGKSTLLALICGVLQPSGGRIYLDGLDLTALSQAKRDAHRARTMGVVFQTLGLASALTVRENLNYACRFADCVAEPADVERLLAQFGIADCGQAKPRQLSRGQAQRAALCRALITKPKVLVADEPTSSLDASWRDQVIDALLETSRMLGTTLIIATHDPVAASRFERQIDLGGGSTI